MYAEVNRHIHHSGDQALEVHQVHEIHEIDQVHRIARLVPCTDRDPSVVAVSTDVDQPSRPRLCDALLRGKEDVDADRPLGDQLREMALSVVYAWKAERALRDRVVHHLLSLEVV